MLMNSMISIQKDIKFLILNTLWFEVRDLNCKLMKYFIEII